MHIPHALKGNGLMHIPYALKGNGLMHIPYALKGQKLLAQGNALGKNRYNKFAL